MVWSLERIGHPHQNIAIRHHKNGALSQVFDNNKMVGHFTGQSAQADARRHAQVHSVASYETNGNPNGDEFSREF